MKRKLLFFLAAMLLLILSEAAFAGNAGFIRDTVPEGKYVDTTNNTLDGKIIEMLEKELIKPAIANGGDSVWSMLAKRSYKRYGPIGEEAVLQNRVFYSFNKSDYKDVIHVLPTWFKKYGSKRNWISPALINQIAWTMFLHVKEKESLLFLSQMTLHALAKDNAPYIMDTHANLLYKAGKESEALQWEERAFAASNQDEGIRINLEKMKAGKPTWSETAGEHK